MLEQLTDARCSQLSPREQHKLRCYEATIARGVRAHGDLGLALAGIRDARLYRATYPSFEAYCAERWEFGQRYVAAVIAVSDLAEDLGD